MRRNAVAAPVSGPVCGFLDMRNGRSRQRIRNNLCDALAISKMLREGNALRYAELLLVAGFNVNEVLDPYFEHALLGEIFICIRHVK